MTSTTDEPKGFKQKLVSELREMLLIAAFLGAFFCTLTLYSTLLLREFDVAYYAFGTALLNAVILAKVILLGEYARLGRKHEGKALMIVAVVKALQFALLMALFHIVEEVIKHLLHGHTPVGAVRELTAGKMAVVGAHMLVIFCALVPFFAFRELQRVLGKEKVADLFLRRGAAAIVSAK